jgi:phage gpG-like protein
VGDPWNTQSITDSDGKTTTWKDLSDDYAAEKYAYKKEYLQFRSPTGKPIQAPWNYETGCMMKIPKTMKVRVPEALKRKLILIRNGALKRGIIPKKSFARGKIQFVVTVKGTAKKYAWYHMFGAPNRKSRSGTPNPLPARPFMVWTRQDITKLIKILYQWVANKTR